MNSTKLNFKWPSLWIVFWFPFDSNIDTSRLRACWWADGLPYVSRSDPNLNISGVFATLDMHVSAFLLWSHLSKTHFKSKCKQGNRKLVLMTFEAMWRKHTSSFSTYSSLQYSTWIIMQDTVHLLVYFKPLFDFRQSNSVKLWTELSKSCLQVQFCHLASSPLIFCVIIFFVLLKKYQHMIFFETTVTCMFTAPWVSRRLYKPLASIN